MTVSLKTEWKRPLLAGLIWQIRFLESFNMFNNIGIICGSVGNWQSIYSTVICLIEWLKSCVKTSYELKWTPSQGQFFL